jgi:hypothetical protein
MSDITTPTPTSQNWESLKLVGHTSYSTAPRAASSSVKGQAAKFEEQSSLDLTTTPDSREIVGESKGSSLREPFEDLFDRKVNIVERWYPT